MEEALVKKKPILCFGLPNYNHFKFYEESSNFTYDKNLEIIEKALKKKFLVAIDQKRKLDFSL